MGKRAFSSRFLIVVVGTLLAICLSLLLIAYLLPTGPDLQGENTENSPAISSNNTQDILSISPVNGPSLTTSSLEKGIGNQGLAPVTEASEIFSNIEPFATESNASRCAQKLLFIATSAESYGQALGFKLKFESDKRFDDIPICIAPPRRLPENALACESKPEKRIRCDLSALASSEQAPDISHLVVFADSGKAYVQRGVMYLDKQDSYAVFIHELAHFANFVDEYALSPSLARQFCSAHSAHPSSTQAPNLLLLKENQLASSGELISLEAVYDEQGLVLENPELVKRVENSAIYAKWLEHSGDSTLTWLRSDTCKYGDVLSIKPSAEFTFLEFHDTQHIPELYLRLWREELLSANNQIHFSHEMLHLANKASNPRQLKHWRSMLEASAPSFEPAPAL